MKAVAPQFAAALGPWFALDRTRRVVSYASIVPHYPQSITSKRVLHHLDPWAVAYIYACIVAPEPVPPDHLVTTRFDEYAKASVFLHYVALEGSESHSYVGMHAVTTVVDDPVTTQDNVIPKNHVNACAVPTRIAAKDRLEVEVVVVDSVVDEPDAARADVYARLTVVMDVEVPADAVRPAHNSHPPPRDVESAQQRVPS